jgi:alkylhydroperoxidase family enzyme
MTDQEMGAMADWDTSALFDETDCLVLRYTEAITRNNRVDDALYGELEARFAREELVKLSVAASLAGFVNRMHATFQTDLDGSTVAEVGDAAFCPIGH